MVPSYLQELKPDKKKSGRYTFRTKNDFAEPDWRLTKYRKSFLPFAISLWNRLDENTRKITNYESFKDTLMANTIDNPLFYVGSRQEQIIMAKLRMGGSNLNGHLYSMKLIDSPACSCGFINENEFHFFLVCPLYNRPRVTLQNAMGNIAPFTLRTLLYGSENLDLTVNKRIVTETLRFIKDSKRFDPWLHDSVCRVHVLTVCFVIRSKYLICHHLIDVHLYKFFTCLDINKTCLNHRHTCIFNYFSKCCLSAICACAKKSNYTVHYRCRQMNNRDAWMVSCLSPLYC